MIPSPTYAPLLMRCGQSAAALRWDGRAGVWRWLDPLAGLLYSLAPDATQAQALRLQEHAAVMAPCASGRVLLGQGKRLGMVELPASAASATATATGRPLQAQVLATIDPAEPRTVISDGCNDRAGNFVFGSANIAADRRPIGSFYQFSQRYGLRRLALPTVATAAGIAFSADGTLMYFADATLGAIMRCRYDAERARVGDAQLFAQAGGAFGAHGGVLLVDSQDQVWSAHGPALCRHDASGAVRQMMVIGDQVLAGAAAGGLQLDQLLLIGADGGIFRVSLQSGQHGLTDCPFEDAPADAVMPAAGAVRREVRCEVR
jgi:L-arabinonolactonase